MILRRCLLVATGAVIGLIGAVVAWATIHPAPGGVRYSGSYVPLQGEQTSAYQRRLTVSYDPTTHPAWAVVVPIGIVVGIGLVFGLAAFVHRARAKS